MVLGEVEESIITKEIDLETDEEIVKVVLFEIINYFKLKLCE
jgi:hypothetical protein